MWQTKYQRIECEDDQETKTCLHVVKLDQRGSISPWMLDSTEECGVFLSWNSCRIHWSASCGFTL
jgi:hypothetical protein